MLIYPQKCCTIKPYINHIITSNYINIKSRISYPIKSSTGHLTFFRISQLEILKEDETILNIYAMTYTYVQIKNVLCNHK